MNKKVVIIGASGHGKVVADIIIKSGDIVVGFLDDGKEGSVADYKILGKTQDYKKYKENSKFIIAIGNCVIRKKIAEKLQDVEWYTAIHPSANISVIGSEIGEGSVVCSGTDIGPDAKIGVHCIINNNAVVDHDCIVGDFTHISPCACVCGTCSIGSMCHIGAGAVVKNNIFVCDNCVIGAGASVVKNIEESGVYVGVPAEKKNENSNIHKL